MNPDKPKEPTDNRNSDLKAINWSYGLLRPSGELDMFIQPGPVPDEKITNLLGGSYRILPLIDGTAIAIRQEQQGLAPNPHYPGINGTVIVGKMSGETFVGVMGLPGFK